MIGKDRIKGLGLVEFVVNYIVAIHRLIFISKESMEMKGDLLMGKKGNKMIKIEILNVKHVI
jgi:hypothetical protein